MDVRKLNSSVCSALGTFIALQVLSAQPFAYVANAGNNQLSVVNVGNNAVTASIAVPAGPAGVAVTPDGTTVYVSSSNSNSVSAVNASNMSIMTAIPVGSRPTLLAVNPSGSLVYVVNQASNQVSVISNASKSVIATIPVGSHPNSVAFSADGSRAYVTNLWSNDVSTISTASNSVVTTFSTGAGPTGVAVAPSGQRIYVCNQTNNTVSVHDTSGSVVGTIGGVVSPVAIAMTPDGSRAFVVNGNVNAVSVINTASNTVISNAPVGPVPTSVTTSTDGTQAYVVNQFGFSVSVLRASDGAVLNTIPSVGIYPIAIAAVPTAPTALLCTYLLSPVTGANYPAGGGGGSVTVTAAAGCPWSANSNAGWMTVTSGASSNGTGTVTYSVSPNTSVSPATGSLTIAGQFFPVSLLGNLLSGGPPTADSVSPTSGVGASQAAAISHGATQSYTFQFSDPDGWQDLGVLNVLINGALDGRHACYLGYSRPDNTLFLFNDAGDGVLPGMLLNGSGTLSNSQCSVTGIGSSAGGDANTLTLNLNLSFSSAFGGNKLLYMAARDSSQNNSGWQTMGVRGQPLTPPTFPLAVSMSPSSGLTKNPTLTYTYQDQTDAANIQTVWALINSALDGGGACYVAYYRPGNLLFLLPDNGDGKQATSMVLDGSNVNLTNSQCTIQGLGSSARFGGTGNQLTLTLNTTFKAAFAGRKAVWLASSTLNGQISSWQALGTWQVPTN